jgi:hypothetical protein
VVVALYAAFLGWSLRANMFGDDAAITFRYVERLLGGHGLTYNDHERVLGMSNPFYALGLSLVTAVVGNVETATRCVCIALYVASAVLTTRVTGRLSGSRVAGVVAGLLVGTDNFYRFQMMSGLESGLAVVLGLLAVLALLNARETAAGVLVGLAVWTKLDGGLLALGLAVAWLVCRRRFPVRIALVSVAVVLPWTLFALAYYGSPIPQSFIAKLYLQRAQSGGVDRLWIVKFFLSDQRYIFGLGALASVAVIRRMRASERLATLTLLGWFVFHFATFSVLDLSGRFPWYLTVLVPPAIILACVLAARSMARVPVRFRWPAAAVALVLLVSSASTPLRLSFADVVDGNRIKAWEAIDEDRRLGGAFLNAYADPNEILVSGFGWPAYESRLPFFDGSLLNSKAPMPGYAYVLTPGKEADARLPEALKGFIPLATFDVASDLDPGYDSIKVFGRADSAIARHGERYLQYRLSELPAPAPFAATSGLEHVKLDGTTLHAHPPSGATFTVDNARQPVHVVFTPAFNPAVAADKTDGVTFEVWSRGQRLYARHVGPLDRLEPILVPLDGAVELERVEVSFVTTPGPNGNADYDWALWRSVKLVVGAAFLDASRIGDKKWREVWARSNPTPTASKPSTPSRP